MTEHKTPKRRHIRELVMQSLYAFEISKDSPQHVIETILEEIKNKPEDHEFAVTLFLKTINHQSEFDKLIKTKIDNWELYRIALIDKLLLRLALCEIMFFDDIPPKVSINEAIEISKDFSTDDSGTFLNGVLDAILNEMKKNGSLTKSGRGLVNTTTQKSGKE